LKSWRAQIAQDCVVVDQIGVVERDDRIADEDSEPLRVRDQDFCRRGSGLGLFGGFRRLLWFGLRDDGRAWRERQGDRKCRNAEE